MHCCRGSARTVSGQTLAHGLRGANDDGERGKTVASDTAESFTERLHKGYAQSMELTNVVAEEASDYQKIKIFDTVANGRVMVLDDIVQITTRDESAYAEMLTHLPLFEHGKAERVMIVGGGDLSIADEALKHRGLKEVVLVDIDGRVVELCREHFAAINAKAFKDKRLKIEVADAFEYLGRAETKRRLDSARPRYSNASAISIFSRLSLNALALIAAKCSRQSSTTRPSMSTRTTSLRPRCLSASSAIDRSPPPTIITRSALPCSKSGRCVSISA